MNMALMRDNHKRGTGSLAVAGLLLAFVAASATAQPHDTPGNDQSGGVSAYLKLGPTADVETNAADPNPDPDGRFDWSTSYDFSSGVVSHNSEAQSHAADAARGELLSLEDSTGPYLSIAPKEYAGEFNPAYSVRTYDWADLYDFGSQIAYAISKIATDRNRRVPANPVAEVHVAVEKGPIADLPKLSGSNGSTSRPDAAILSAMNK
jgi:hypothetical protein